MPTSTTSRRCRRVDLAVEQGAAIVDVGGVKAGPGEPVDSDEEIRRTASFVAAVRRRHPSLVISVDTWRAEVGRAACEAGADLLNDAWQGFDPGLAVVAAEFGAGWSAATPAACRRAPIPTASLTTTWWPTSSRR